MTAMKFGFAMSLGVCVAACSSLTDLDVPNQKDPDRLAVYRDPQVVEALIGEAYRVTFNAQYDYSSSALPLSAMADEGTMSWGGTHTFSKEPRAGLPNDPRRAYYHFIEDPWVDHYEALSAVYDGLWMISKDTTGEICAEIDCDRARAFGKFVQGVAHGYLALLFDSAFVSDEAIDLDRDSVALLPYPDVMQAALEYFDEAISLATGASWTLESEWINGNPFTAAEFVRLVNSFYARYLTQVSRTPYERGTLAGLGTWNDVVRRIDDGITDDIWVYGDGEELWFNDYLWAYAQSGSTMWGRADYKTIGWSELHDGPGTGYENWLNTNVSDRMEFELHTLDRRIMPHPDSSQSRGLDFMYNGFSMFPASRGTYHSSMYLHHRYDNYPHGGYIGPFPIMVHEAQQLIKAEALLRTGAPQSAVDIINSTRVGRAGLPAASANESESVLMDMLIYEYRIENMNVCPGCALFTRRGWGDLAPTGPYHHQGLVRGTAIHFPVPGGELETLRKPWYTYGGFGNEGTALSAVSRAAGDVPRGTVVPARTVYAFDGLETVAEKLEYLRQSPCRPSPGAANLPRHKGLNRF